jgi:hypothetical protein
MLSILFALAAQVNKQARAVIRRCWNLGHRSPVGYYDRAWVEKLALIGREAGIARDLIPETSRLEGSWKT